MFLLESIVLLVQLPFSHNVVPCIDQMSLHRSGDKMLILGSSSDLQFLIPQNLQFGIVTRSMSLVPFSLTVGTHILS